MNENNFYGILIYKRVRYGCCLKVSDDDPVTGDENHWGCSSIR